MVLHQGTYSIFGFDFHFFLIYMANWASTDKSIYRISQILPWYLKTGRVSRFIVVINNISVASMAGPGQGGTYNYLQHCHRSYNGFVMQQGAAAAAG